MNLADNLKKIRKDNNLSQEQLAEKLGVSRQSVSKWESGLSYPEMDKVLQICQLFNLNINELINEDIKEVNEVKEAQSRSNKYVTSFFEYLTKVVDMFSSMKWKERIKCLFEQGCVALGLLIVLAIIGMVGSEVLHSILNILPGSFYYTLYHLFETLYLVIALVVGVAVLLHIFKIRYLDYYEIVKEDSEVPDTMEVVTEVEAKKVEDEDTKKEKIILEKKKEKVVIRDPKHSEYKFLTGLGKVMLWFVKLIVAFILVGFACSLIAFVVCLPICFLVAKSGLLFIGLMLGIVGAILLNIVILELLYNFIVNKKWNKLKIFIMSIVSLVMVGLGIGVVCVSATEFDIEEKTYDITETTFIYEMNDKLILNSWYFVDGNTQYVEKDIDNVEIVVKHSDLYEAESYENGNVIEMYVYTDESKLMKFIRTVIDDLNHKVIGEYDEQVEVIVYANKANIAKLKENTKNYDERINWYEKRIAELEEELDEEAEETAEIEEEKEKLEEVVGNCGYEISYDENGRITSIYSSYTE